MEIDVETECPGCGLRMPRDDRAVYDGYYHTSAECWSVYTEVLGAEFQNVVVYGQAHQLTVDAYAIQHAGGRHPDKSIGVHLSGLHLVLEQGHKPAEVPPLLQILAGEIETWPHFELPAVETPGGEGALTVCDVALAGSPLEHVAMSKKWASGLWQAWSHCHAEIETLVTRVLTSREYC